jgi:hypothetical protein
LHGSWTFGITVFAQVLLRPRNALVASCSMDRWSGLSLDKCENGKRTASSRDRNRDLRITCIAAIPRSTTELKKLVLVDADSASDRKYIVYMKWQPMIDHRLEIQLFLALAQANDKAHADQAERRRPWLMEGGIVS